MSTERVVGRETVFEYIGFGPRRYCGLDGGVAGVAGGVEGVAGAGVAGVVAAGAAGVPAAGVVPVAGVDEAGAVGGVDPLRTELGPRCPMMASTSAPTMKRTANAVVSFVSSVAPARAPNAA